MTRNSSLVIAGIVIGSAAWWWQCMHSRHLLYGCKPHGLVAGDEVTVLNCSLVVSGRRFGLRELRSGQATQRVFPDKVHTRIWLGGRGRHWYAPAWWVIAALGAPLAWIAIFAGVVLRLRSKHPSRAAGRAHPHRLHRGWLGEMSPTTGRVPRENPCGADP